MLLSKSTQCILVTPKSNFHRSIKMDNEIEHASFSHISLLLTLEVIICAVASSLSAQKYSQLLFISSHIALSAFDDPFNPDLPESVITGSKLAILTSIIASAEGDRPISSAYFIISGLRECRRPKDIWVYRVKATSNCYRLHRLFLVNSKVYPQSQGQHEFGLHQIFVIG